MAEAEIFTEMKCGANFAYILGDNSRFLTTEYKVLQSQTGGCFLRSMKMLYNGKTELYYMTEGCRALSDLSHALDADRFLETAGNLLEAVSEVKNNGFLVCRNLDISSEKIYVDVHTYKVRLVYLPVSNPFFQDDSEFESALRAELIKAAERRSDRQCAAMARFAADLADGALTLEEIDSRLRGGRIQKDTGARQDTGASQDKGCAAQSMCLVTMSAPRVEIKITKDEFVIGKKASMVDGAVTFNRMISRVHCKVIRRGKEYAAVDLRSANGTFINGKRLSPEQPYPIRNGDVVRLANTDFQVVIR